MPSPYNSSKFKFETQTPQSTGSNNSGGGPMKRKSFSSLLRKGRGNRRDFYSGDDRSDDCSPHNATRKSSRASNDTERFARKSRFNARRGSAGSNVTSSAGSDPSSAAGSAFSQTASFVKNLPGGRTVAPYPPLQKQDSLDSLYSDGGQGEGARFNSDALRRRIMQRRNDRKNRHPSGRRTASPDSDTGYPGQQHSTSPPPRRAPARRARQSGAPDERMMSKLRSKLVSPVPGGHLNRHHPASKSTSDLLNNRSNFQSPRKSAPLRKSVYGAGDLRSPVQSPARTGEDEYKRDSRSPVRRRSYSPEKRKPRYSESPPRGRQEQNYTPKQSRANESDSAYENRRRSSRKADWREGSPGGATYSDRERHPYKRKSRANDSESPRPRRKSHERSPPPRRKSHERDSRSPPPRRGSGGASRRKASPPRSPLSSSPRRKRRADTYPSPKHVSRSPSPLPAKKKKRAYANKSPVRQRSTTPPGRGRMARGSPYRARRDRTPPRRARSPSCPQPQSKRATTSYRLSELIPDCRLYHIEARGGRRDFRKWFSTLPPNVQVDKDMRTDRGVFKKDNFATSDKLDEYLGIDRSISPKKDRHREKRDSRDRRR